MVKRKKQPKETQAERRPLPVLVATFFSGVLLALTLIAIALLGGCAANLGTTGTTTTSQTPLLLQNSQAAALTGAHISFHFSNFYSLSQPNPSTGCAGDAKTFYDPFTYSSSAGGLGYVAYDASLADSTTTIKPSFISNVSVNLTDANAPVSSNLAQQCSLGTSSTSPPVSNCSTFDFGAIGGLPTNLGGTLLLIGGLQSTNYNFSLGTYGGVTVACGPAADPATVLSSGNTNSCGSSVFGLGFNTLPSTAAGTVYAPELTSATGPISVWSNISGQPDYTGPTGAAGSSASFDAATSSVLLFGGAAPLTGMGATGAGQLNADTWVFDMKAQTWTQVTTHPTIDSKITTQQDVSLETTDFKAVLPPLAISKTPGGRSLFGYVAVPGMALNRLTSNGIVTTTAATFPYPFPFASMIDTTDRIITIGGVGSCAYGVCTDSIRFNPTFGPEYYENLGPVEPIYNSNAFLTSGPISMDTFLPTQWIDSSPDTLISNSFSAPKTPTPTVISDNSNYYPTAFPVATPTPSASPPPTGATTFNHTATAAVAPNPTSINFGATFLTNQEGTTGISGTGYLLVGGGFYGYQAPAGLINNVGAGAPCPDTLGNAYTSTLNCGGDLQIGFRRGRKATAPERDTGNYGFTTNVTSNAQNSTSFDESTPIDWQHLVDGSAATNTTMPWFGGGVMLPGINRATNDVIFFGGTDCRNYLTTGCVYGSAAPMQKNPSRYWSFGIDPENVFHSTAYGVSNTAIGAGQPTLVSVLNPPTNAGMAAARGADMANNPLIVAWGGMVPPTSSNASPAATSFTVDSSGTIYYLYSKLTVPTWATATIGSGSGPVGMGNASLVYSHVTGKFYLFGGYDPVTRTTSADTWELSLSSTTPQCGLQATDTCQFNWRKLTGNGLTCYPNCPQARRSHRMVEANYNNITPNGEPNCTAAGAPCSFGIFMSGGTPNGVSSFSDRWMFDPTANGGNGHWQNVGSFPPRVLASMASADYFVPSLNGMQHVAVLFGGETGMENPAMAQARSSTAFFVPPTLGDTWMFDYSTKIWNRVALKGTGYASTFNFSTTIGEAEGRQASLMADQILSPPPLSGAMMVTRTARKVGHTVVEAALPLAIPEIFLFGGRGKDGMIQTLGKVYKFCSGTTGEKPYRNSFTGTPIVSFPLPGSMTLDSNDDATCDAYDQVSNPKTFNPSPKYVGRWLYKTPPSSTNNVVKADLTTATTNFDPNSMGSYMGAATYDNAHDLILMYGGITPTVGGPHAITDTSGWTLDPTIVLKGTVLEYTPPSKSSASNGLTQIVNASATPSTQNGTWNKVLACQDGAAPSNRYGHTMGYDASSQSLFVVGGYDSSKQLLGQAFDSSGSQTIPEVWSATRIDLPMPSGIPARGINSVTLGDINGNFPCYYWQPVTSFGNAADQAPVAASAHTASVYIPSSGYNTGYYSMFDTSCVKSGPIFSTDDNVNKLLVGGVYFDIDRTQLKPNENLILNLTFLPLGQTNLSPKQSFLKEPESAVFKVHLVKTGQNSTILKLVSQPRDFTYAATDVYPQIAQSIAVLSQPTGQMRQEQIFLPIAIDPLIDRIHLQRLSGDAVLIGADLLRAGGY